jgi:tetratricopeptide (TPR) repeat protein
LGAAFTIKSATKHDPNGYILAIDQLQKSVTLQPNYGPAHMILGWILAIYGKYDEAEASFRRAAAIEESGKFEGVKFVGALALLGDLELRRNQLDKALDLYERSLTSLEKVEHLYKNQFAALTHCGIAEAHYLRGLFDQALEHYKTAAELARNNPKSLGIGHILAKALFGLAVVFHKLGMKRESEQHLRDGFELVESRSLYDFSWMWDGSDAQLFYDVTRCLAVMNRRQEAIDYLQRAIDCGWGDTLLLGADELLANIRPEARFQSLLEHLKSVVPPINERLPPSS